MALLEVFVFIRELLKQYGQAAGNSFRTIITQQVLGRILKKLFWLKMRWQNRQSLLANSV
jgi:hypothetical protein